MTTLVDSLPSLPARPDDGHKGTFGRVTLIGGWPGMTGSIALAAMAALRSGAGLVSVQCPAESMTAVASHDPCYMTGPLDASSRGRADAIGIGPGLPPDQFDALPDLLAETTGRPLLCDAGAIDLVARDRDAVAAHASPLVLTPHPGEFARLSGLSVAVVESDRRSHAEALARDLGAVVVLKGQGTIVTDGERTAINATGNSGLATGGTGDVLTGIVTALLGQGVAAWEAARIGVHVHGLAGDLAAAKLGQRSMTALDVVRSLAAAWMQFEQQPQT